MLEFVKQDFVIEKIELACLVAEGKAAPTHKNRKNHGLAFFRAGEAVLTFENKKIKAVKNTLVYFPKGSDYTVREIVPTVCYAINFQMQTDRSFDPFAVQLKNADVYLQSFRESRKIWTKKSTGYSTKIKSELYNILYHLQNECELPYANTAVIEPAVSYIHSNYDKEMISVAFLAQLCGISQVHLRNLFMRRFALSPIRYVNRLKMTRAEELLSSQMYGVSDACFLSGFRDESYFSREFKKYFGVTPSEYVKSSRL